MNVLSLPDEMLASVLKYKSSENLAKLRKVSSKIDSVVLRYNLDKWNTESLTISHHQTNIRVQVAMYKKFTVAPSADLLDILNYYFSRTRGVKELHIIKSRDEHQVNFIKPISNEVGEFLGRSCKNITILTINGWDISIDFNTMKRIMTKLKLKELKIKASFTEFYFSDAVIEGISFDCLELINTATAAKLMTLSLPYLARLCALKIPSTLTCAIKNSTITDLLEFFKLLTEEKMRNVDKWTIVISKGKMSVDETKQYISNLKCFEDYKVTQWNEVRPDTTVYLITTGKIRSYYSHRQSILIKTDL